MRLISGRTVLVVSLAVGLPLILIGNEGDAAVTPAKCSIEVNYPNITLPRNGWFGYPAKFACTNHDPSKVGVTFQILRAGEVYASMHATTSPLQLTTKCARGGPVVEFRPKVSISVKDARSNKRRFFTKTGPPYHWRCVKR